MKLFSKCLDYFVTGMGFGAICYLCILTFSYPGVAPTIKGVSSVLLLSGLIGLLSMIFRTELPLLSAIIIHIIGTFILFLIMVLVNNWIMDWASIIVFILAYVIIWSVIILEQRKAINKINKKIIQRNKK